MTDDRDITDDVMEQWREICEESHAKLEKGCENLEMTDEEMAEEYCNEEVPFDTTESGEKLYTENDLKQAYLAGLKTGRPQWHKVADGDLPKDEDYKCCISSNGIYYIARYEELFVSWTNQEYKEVCCPYAWKEIISPKESE
jgi:hypothetical protein